MSKCICELEVGEEYNLDYSAAWAYLGFKRREDGFYIMGHGDNCCVYKANFCPECGKSLKENEQIKG